MRLRNGFSGWGDRCGGDGAVEARVATGSVGFGRALSDRRATRMRWVAPLGRMRLALMAALLLAASSLTALGGTAATAAASRVEPTWPTRAANR